MSSQLLMQGMLGTGRAHVSEICELARSNVQDGLPSESLVAFSSLGANGAYTSTKNVTCIDGFVDFLGWSSLHTRSQ